MNTVIAIAIAWWALTTALSVAVVVVQWELERIDAQFVDAAQALDRLAKRFSEEEGTMSTDDVVGRLVTGGDR